MGGHLPGEKVTAEIAVPKPSQSGENIEYARVQGSGVTIADALNEINSKTGFFPKLVFCDLILIGDGVKDKELFTVLSSFYRKDYSELTALVAMCDGKASDMLSSSSAMGGSPSDSIQKVLSKELERAANVSSVNLKDIAASGFSVSKACYMPYIEKIKPATSEQGGNGDSVGGESSGESSGESGGESGGDSVGGQQEKVEFISRKTAYFRDGKFVGILDDAQSFALAVLENKVHSAILPCNDNDTHYSLTLKQVGGGVKFKVDGGIPKLSVSFSASAQIRGMDSPVSPSDLAKDDIVPDSVLRAGEKAVRERLENLVNTSITSDCDFLGVKDKLFKFYYKYYDAYKDNVLQRMQTGFQVKIKSSK